MFAAVQDCTVDYGVVPFENSTYGPVIATLDLFGNALKRPKTSTDGFVPHLRSYSDLSAFKDLFIPVQHCLLGNLPNHADNQTGCLPELTNGHADDSAKELERSGVDQLPSLSHITLVQSHEQAIGQCKNFLTTELPRAVRKEVSSTSRAAELAAEDPSGATVAISSELAAELYGLSVLRRGIQDREDNVTRFLVLQRVTSGPDSRHIPTASNSPAAGQTQTQDIPTSDQHKALIIFTVSHKMPGALAATLETFKEAGINLTSINTRPSGLSAWHYFFFVEVEGARSSIEDVLVSLQDKAESSKCLGIWPKVDDRNGSA